MKPSPQCRKRRQVDHSSIPEVMEYATLSERLRKTLYYGILPKQERPSWALTNVVMEKFSERDENSLFLEKLRFEYASNLSREACVSPCSLVLALIYLERLMKSNPNYVSSIPSSKLFLVSVMVASKFLNDEGEEDEVFNHEWANCAQIDVAQLNQLEREFLTAIDWSLFVDEEDFATALAEIEYKVARSESLKRGWMTYTDLDILGRTQLLLDTWDLMVSQVINVSLACTAAYLASLVTLVGSALVVSSLPWNAPHQLPTDLTIDTGSISTTGNRLSHLSVDGSGSSHCTESSLDLETEPDVEALLSNLTQFANIVQDDDDNDQSKLDTFTFPQWLVSHLFKDPPTPQPPCVGPDWLCSLTSIWAPRTLGSGEKRVRRNSTVSSNGIKYDLYSEFNSFFQVAERTPAFQQLASCAVA